MKRSVPVILLLLVAASVYWFNRSPRSTPKSSSPSSPPPPVSAPAAQPAATALRPPAEFPVASPSSSTAVTPGVPIPGSNSAARAAAEVPPLPPELAGLPPETVLENMRTTIRQYGAMFDGNPVGTNPEITKALQGDNPKHINFLKADGNRVNGNGELVDVWGTPYFFHQLSGTEMEIRSAGPDKRMWTSDDLVTK